jgi:hypothetical protein
VVAEEKQSLATSRKTAGRGQARISACSRPNQLGRREWRVAAVLMATRDAPLKIYKLMEAAEGRWRRLNGAHLVALVRAGAGFENGELVEGGSKEKVAA